MALGAWVTGLLAVTLRTPLALAVSGPGFASPDDFNRFVTHYYQNPALALARVEHDALKIRVGASSRGRRYPSSRATAASGDSEDPDDDQRHVVAGFGAGHEGEVLHDPLAEVRIARVRLDEATSRSTP